MKLALIYSPFSVDSRITLEWSSVKKNTNKNIKLCIFFIKKNEHETLVTISMKFWVIHDIEAVSYDIVLIQFGLFIFRSNKE